MKHRPLGVKLTLWSALIVTVALFASALASDIFVYRAERRELDSQLRATARHFFEQFHIHGSLHDWVASHEVEEVFSPRDETRFVLVQAADGRALYRSPNLPAGLELPSSGGMHDLRIGEVTTRLGVFREHGLTLYLAGDTVEITNLVTRLALGHLAALPFVLAVVVFGGRWLGRQALEPVKAMADAADSIHPEELHQRLPAMAQEDELGRLTRAFNRMLDRLERGFQQATRFSSDASHELRTPLTLLRANIEELQADASLTEKQRDAVAELQLQTQHLISITSTLLLLAQADAGRLRLQLEDADLRDIVRDCLEDARILAEQREVRIESDLAEPAPVQVDPVRVRQVVLNLLSNAVKFNQPGGRVALRLGVTGGRCRLFVGNTGPAISETEQAGLFGRFFRAGQQEDAPGAGLGLSLARELARSHGGEVTLVGSRDGWNEFELVLPQRSVKRDEPPVPKPDLANKAG